MGADGSPPCRQARGPRRLAAANRLFREAVLRIARTGAPGAIFRHSGLEFCRPALPPLALKGVFEMPYPVTRISKTRTSTARSSGSTNTAPAQKGKSGSFSSDDGPAGSCRRDRLSWRQDEARDKSPAAAVAFKINPEAAFETLEMPFAFLMNAANPRLRHEEFDGKPRHFHAMPYGARNIWGVTTGISRNLCERLHF